MPDAHWRPYAQYMMNYIQSPGFKEVWDDIGPGFSEDFVRWVDGLLTNLAPTNGKAKDASVLEIWLISDRSLVRLPSSSLCSTSRIRFGRTPTPSWSATAQAVHEHFAKWYRLVAADAEFSKIVATERDYGSLSEEERVRFIATFMSFLSYSQNAFLKWREKLLAPPLWMGWELVIMNLVCAPGGKAF